jgi:hypothetical protein
MDDRDLILRRVAAGTLPTRLPDIEALDDRSVYHLLGDADVTSMTGQIYHAWQSGVLPLTDEQQSRAASLHQRAMRQALQVERRLLDAASLLDHAGVSFRLLKGVALAHAVYSDPAHRSFVDADLLIAPSQMSTAVRVLTEAGGRRNIPEVFPGHDDQFAKSVTILIGGRALDLHRTLLAGPFGVTLPVDALFERPTPIQIGDRVVPALDTVDLYIHAAVTAGVVDVPPRPVTFCDMAYLERMPGFSCEIVKERALAYGLGDAVARGVQMQQSALHLVDPPRLHDWALSYRPAWRERQLTATYLGRGRAYRRTVGMLVALPTWRQRLALARAVAMPSPAYREARAWTRRQHIARAYRKVLGR